MKVERGSEIIYEYKKCPVAIFNKREKYLKFFGFSFNYNRDIKKMINNLLRQYRMQWRLQSYNGNWYFVCGNTIKNYKDYTTRLHNDVIPFRDGMYINKSGFVFYNGCLVGVPKITETKQKEVR